MDEAKMRKILIPALGTMPELLLVSRVQAAENENNTSNVTQVGSGKGNEGEGGRTEKTVGTQQGQSSVNDDELKPSPQTGKEDLTSLKNEMATIQEEVNTTKTQVQGITDKAETTYMLLGAVGVVALVALIFALLAYFVKGSKTKKDRTPFSVAHPNAGVSGGNQADIFNLQQEVAALREELERMRRSAQSRQDSGAAEQRTAASQQNAPAWSEFVEAYNALAQRKLTGFEARDARNDFGRRFGVRAFSCANFEQRMNRPDLPPVFADEPNIANGEYWAMPCSGGLYVVVPCMKTYEARNHSEGGMKEAFHSNFENGRTYNVITVIKPAIFQEGWKILRQGKLQLSN